MVDSNSKSLLAFGEVLFDIINGQEHLGGAPFNVAAHFSRFNNQAFLISAVGNDQKGKQVIETATQYRMNISYLKTLESKATGIVDVNIDQNGQPSYQIVEDVAWDFIELVQEEYQSIQHKNWNCFYFGMLAQRNEVSRNTLNKVLALNQFDQVFFDVNLRKNYYSKELLENSFSKCSILKLNEEEIDVIALLLYRRKYTNELFAKEISIQYNIPIVIITLGANGAACYTNGVFTKVEGVKVKVADTVGAGDSFSAAFLNAFLKGEKVENAIEAGCRLGAYVASQHGAVPNY